MPVFIYRCGHCRHSIPVPPTVARDSAPVSDRCARCGGPLELAREELSHFPSHGQSRTIADRLHIRNAWLMIAETWYAWHTSRNMLKWYRKVRSEEPGLTGRDLYVEVLKRRSGLHINDARRIVLRAKASFCSWPSAHELRYRHIVLYVAVQEYLQSHKESLGTQTTMVAIVTRVIPEDLEGNAPH